MSVNAAHLSLPVLTGLPGTGMGFVCENWTDRA